MKTNFSLDLTLILTILSIFTFSCGYFYINSYFSHLNYDQAILGLNLQEYMVAGGLRGMKGIIWFFLILLGISLINSIYNKSLNKTLEKIISYTIAFPFVFLYHAIFIKIFKAIYWILTNVIIIKNLYTLLVTILRFIVKILAFIFRSTIVKTHHTISTGVVWDNRTDSDNASKFTTELLTHNFALVGILLVTLSALSFLINIEKTAKKDVVTHLNSNKNFVNILVKDDLLKEIKLVTPDKSNYRLGKILYCGPTNCLIAFQRNNATLPLQDKNFSNLKTDDQIKRLLDKYIIKPIPNTGYVALSTEK
ncbi:hypothetical protein ACX1NX_00555 [Acinetobacter sp. ANC 5383]